MLPFSCIQVEEGTAVAIYAEGKEHAMAIGFTTMSTAQVRESQEQRCALHHTPRA